MFVSSNAINFSESNCRFFTPGWTLHKAMARSEAAIMTSQRSGGGGGQYKVVSVDCCSTGWEHSTNDWIISSIIITTNRPCTDDDVTIDRLMRLL